MLCDGCNVNEGWEHRCHTRNQKPSTITVRGERIPDALCSCPTCKIEHEFAEKLRRESEDALRNSTRPSGHPTGHCSLHK